MFMTSNVAYSQEALSRVNELLLVAKPHSAPGLFNNGQRCVVASQQDFILLVRAVTDARLRERLAASGAIVNTDTTTKVQLDDGGLEPVAHT